MDPDRHPEPAPHPDDAPAPVEPARHPAPGITHEPEPDAENLIPIDDGPGTF
jgi:hypothetical protein